MHIFLVGTSDSDFSGMYNSQMLYECQNLKMSKKLFD